MIMYLKGNLLSSPAQVLVNTVNTVGVMGKGIALQFKNKYPDMFKAYQKICEEHRLDIGMLYLWKSEDKWILMFPTKKHWRNPSKIEYIEKGLEKFVNNYEKLGIESIAFPRLGCGNGKLDWQIVKPIMEKYLKPLPITVYIYVDNYNDGTPEHIDENFENWIHEKPRDMSFLSLKEELQALIKQNNGELLFDGGQKSILWNDDKIIIKNGHEIKFNEEIFCDFWDYIKNVGIIEKKKIPQSFSDYSTFMIDLLKNLKYLQPVLASGNENLLDESIGYQLTEG